MFCWLAAALFRIVTLLRSRPPFISIISSAFDLSACLKNSPVTAEVPEGRVSLCKCCSQSHRHQYCTTNSRKPWSNGQQKCFDYVDDCCVRSARWVSFAEQSVNCTYLWHSWKMSLSKFSWLLGWSGSLFGFFEYIIAAINLPQMLIPVGTLGP